MHSHHPHYGHRFARIFHGPGGHHGERGRHGRSGLGRFFAHGDLRLVILHLIADKPRHGYEIIKAIEEQVAGAYSPSPGVVYPTLTLLEELGYVTVTVQDGPKKLHEITDAGRAYLATHKAAVDALLAQMAEASHRRAGAEAPPIVRAVENLKLALRLRIARGMTEADITAIAARLDEAAVGIEKV